MNTRTTGQVPVAPREIRQNSSSRPARALILACICTLLSPLLRAQEPDPDLRARIKALEEQNRRILLRLEKSEDKNGSLESDLEQMRLEYESGAMEEALSESINAVTSRYQDAVTWQRLTRSGNPLRIYGFVRLDAYYQTARTNNIIIPFIVAAENGVDAEANDEGFAFDARLTQLAFEIDAGRIGDADVMALIEMDFANFPSDTTESRATPRIRLAYINLDFGTVTIRLGQDWDVIAPLNPAVNAEFGLWNAGNLGDRRPMAQLIWETGDPSGTTFTLEIAAGLTGANDDLDLDVSVGPTTFSTNERDGFDSGLPNGQARFAVGFNSWVEGQRAVIGVWGAVAALETDVKFGGEDEFTAWLAGADVVLPFFGPLSVRGEVWIGEALGDFRGAIGQTINTATGQEIQSWGGWLELHWQATDNFRVAIGTSYDNPEENDVAPGVRGQDRDRNWTVYISSQLDWGGGLVSGLDVIYWETQYATPAGTDIGNMVRINFWTMLTF